MHRPKYDDWSWAKGKLDPGEHPCVAAARETLEETGLVVRLGVPLPSAEYPVLDSTGGPATKQVHYWSARVTGGTGVLEHEIDEVALGRRAHRPRPPRLRPRPRAAARPRPRRACRRAAHVAARVRTACQGDPARQVGGRRPASAARCRGARAGGQPSPPCSGPTACTRVVSSSSARCVSTVEPYAAGQGLRLRTRDVLSEEGFAESPVGAVAQVQRLLERGDPAALCSHGPVLPTLLGLLHTRVDALAGSAAASRTPLQGRGRRGHAQGRGARLPPRRTWRGRARRRRRAHRHLSAGRPALATASRILHRRPAGPRRIPSRRRTPRRRPAFTLR